MTSAILSSCFLSTQFQAERLKLWADLRQTLDPDAPILLIDGMGPIRASDVLANRDIEIHRLDHDIGTRATTGKDGGVEATAIGMNLLFGRPEVDWIVFIESDMFFYRRVEPVISRLQHHRIKVACPFDPMYQFMEAGLTFYDVATLREIGYVTAYDWDSPPPPPMFHERWMEQFFGDDLHILNLRGCRDDMNQITVATLEGMFPYGADYLTHCGDLAVYRKLARINGIMLPPR